MPQLTLDGKAVSVPAGKRLINALTDEGGADQLHSCGGVGKCTSCRVQFVGGEPDQMTQIEQQLLAAKGLQQQAGVRLSCQIACNADMSVKIISRFAGSGKKDAGGRPADAIEPPPTWIDRV